MRLTAPFQINFPTAITFGAGAIAQLAHVLPDRARHVVVITGAGGVAAQPVLTMLTQMGVEVMRLRCGAEPSVASLAETMAGLTGATPDAVVACGGGSVLDTGKLVAFLLSHNITLTDDFGVIDPALLAAPSPIPCIAIPTTAGTGAEVTANAVLSVPSKAAKLSLRGRALVPAAALVDPDLMTTAPPHIRLGAGLDAVTQVIEAYCSNAATPFSDALSRPAIERGLTALRGVMEGVGGAAWADIAWVSLASGLALANAGLGAVHGLAAVLGGRYAAPHGALCGRLLVPVLRCNLARATPGSDAHDRLNECVGIIARQFPARGGADQFAGFEAWMTDHALPRLLDWGVQRVDYAALATEAMAASSTQKNPVTLAQADFVDILDAAS